MKLFVAKHRRQDFSLFVIPDDKNLSTIKYNMRWDVFQLNGGWRKNPGCHILGIGGHKFKEYLEREGVGEVESRKIYPILNPLSIKEITESIKDYL